MKRLLALLLCLALALSMTAAMAADDADDAYDEIPWLLRFEQSMTPYQWINDQLYTITMYPQTANPAVDNEIAQVVSAMEQHAKAYLPSTVGDSTTSHLITGSTISRTGKHTMSFLTTSSVTHVYDQIYVDYQTNVFNMETGERITMKDMFPADSYAWELLASEVRMQLTQYFAGIQPNAEMLNALSTREALEQASFTLTPASMLLTYRADTLYPGRQQLMQVRLYYRDIRPYMTAEMFAETDNSRYRMVALTYDDGCARGDSMAVINQLRRFGAGATFFVVGGTIGNNQDVLAYEHDSGFTVASHNYVHVYKNLNRTNVLNWKRDFDVALNNAIGIRPTIMRAPGGIDDAYCSAKVGLPVIHWSLSPEDAGTGPERASSIANRVGFGAKPGDVVLMHDVNPNCRTYTADLLPILEDRNFLCVTVEELFSHYGVKLEPNTAYMGCTGLMVQ